MKRSGIINAELMAALSAMRHSDTVGIIDYGLRPEPGVKIIDLSLVPGIPTFMDVFKAVLNEFIFDQVDFFGGMPTANPELYKTICDALPNHKKEILPPMDFVAAASKAFLLIRTGDNCPACSILLHTALGIPGTFEPYDVRFD